MKFSKEKAKEIIEKFQLSPATMKTWEHRGGIPERYANPAYIKPEPISDSADKIIQDRVVSILNMPELNRHVLANLAGCNITRVNSVTLKKSTMTNEELLAIRKEIKRLKIDISKRIEKYNEKDFISLIKDKRLKPFVIINDKDFARRLSFCKNLGKVDFERARDEFAKVAIQLNVS